MRLITKTVIIKWNAKNKQYFESKNYIYTKIGDEFEVKVEDLSISNRNKVSLISSNLGELFSCMMCFPFWAGVIISVLDINLINVTFTPFNMLFNGQTVDFVTIVVILVMDGIISSGTTWILHNIEEYFEQ